MKHVMLPFVVTVFLAAPALAQSRLYTNADLGRPLNPTRTPTAEEMQGLRAHQFTLSATQDEPQTFVLPYDPVWPFTYSQRLELDPWRMPSGWPLYGPWAPYGYPFVISPGPYPFDCCRTKPHIGASRGAVNRGFGAARPASIIAGASRLGFERPANSPARGFSAPRPSSGPR